MQLFEFVGQQIRALRTSNPSGISYSQEALGKALDVAPNTISRWETATYKPTIKDLDSLARLFKVSILDFFPRDPHDHDERVAALLRTAKQLDAGDLEELRRFADFIRAESRLRNRRRSRGGARA